MTRSPQRPRRTLVCGVGAVRRPDVATVDALAKMQLAALRHGCTVRLRDASPRLVELLELVGLREVLGCCEPSALEARRQSEEREEAFRVQEEVQPADPFA